MSDNTSVRVAVRVRPLVTTEISRGCQDIIDVIGENQQIVVKSVDKDRAYTFNYVLSSKDTQEAVYKTCVDQLIGNLFKGYNLTILAYGQTGSGKTHTMGTTYNGEGEMGVIPRAVSAIFAYIRDNFSYDFTVSVTFMELYQEVLYDLLSDKPREQCVLEIREDPTRGIYIPNLTEIEVNSVKSVFEALEKGTAGRATSATAMNAQSSRSHAIITMNITMTNRENNENKIAKLQLVDLAGSERPKKTQATGNTFKEGVNINKGLLALGNVISSLGDEKSQHGFIPYRDSNLTRLLKDSLGGNSITLMIACVSPADYNLEETVSTLRYADRAKKIKNKPVVNQDPKTAEINSLKKTIQQLRLQLIGQGSVAIPSAEVELMQKEILELKSKKRYLSTQLSASLITNTELHEKIIILQTSNETQSNKLLELKQEYDAAVENLTEGLENSNPDLLKDTLSRLRDMKNQFNEINIEQKKTEEQLSAHSEVKHMSESIEMTNDLEEAVEDHQEHHADRQFKLNVQLTEIEKELNVKESLAKHLMSANQYVIDLKAMAENEAKIVSLEKEKEELLQMLKNIGNSGKIAEQRRKRVQDLEQQLVDLKKKVQEQNHLAKLKAKAEDRIKVLNQEILQMKQAKVKLVKTMREESDKFRHWKLEKERECIRLKREDIKKAHEINKMKVMHNKQQNVFKRRVEEAEAINKRLKQVLSLKQQAQEQRNSGKVVKLEPWLKQEFDLCANLVEAEVTLKVLLDDRATLQAQLDEMRSSGDNSEECKSIEDDLELRSLQIQDLQQKLLDSDEESRSKTRFDKFQTMAEAKFALKFLFSRSSDEVKEKVICQTKLRELQELYNETVEKLKDAKKEHAKQTEDLRKQYEIKIDDLFKQIGGEQSILEEQLVEKEKQIAELQEEVESLQKRIKDILELSSGAPKTPAGARELKTTFMVPNEEKSESLPSLIISPVVEKRQTSFEATPENRANNQNDSMEELFDEDNIHKDPDWRKTPLGVRILKEKKIEKKNYRASTLSFEDDKDKPVKRSSDGGCTCKTNCKGSRCGCRRMGNNCGPSCKCKGCENQVKENSTSEDEFKKPSPSEIPSKRKKTRNMFTLDK